MEGSRDSMRRAMDPHPSDPPTPPKAVSHEAAFLVPTLAAVVPFTDGRRIVSQETKCPP